MAVSWGGGGGGEEAVSAMGGSLMLLLLLVSSPLSLTELGWMEWDFWQGSSPGQQRFHSHGGVTDASAACQ